MNQSQLFPPCSKAISSTKKETGLSGAGAAKGDFGSWDGRRNRRDGWQRLAADQLLADTETLYGW